MLLKHDMTPLRSTTRAGARVAHYIRSHQSTLIPLAVALFSRLVIFLTADALLRYEVAQGRYAYLWDGPIAVWDRLDAGWYLAIAQTGYNYSTHTGSRANFFPLYPILVAVIGRLAQALHLPDPYILAGMAISWATFAIACVLLYRLILTRFDRRVAVGAILVLCAFPFSLYYGVPYTESIYLALTVGGFLAIERERWWTAGLIAGVASASRPPGLIVGACVVLAYALDWWLTRHPLQLNALSLALTPLGALAYMLYCYVRFGDPLAYIRASHAGWNGGHLQLGGLRYIAHILRHPVSWIGAGDATHIFAAFAVFVLLSFLALLPFTWRLLGPVYTFFCLASIFSPILTFPNANSLGRYLSVIFPIFIALAYLLREHPRVLVAFCAFSGALLILFATYFIATFGLQ